jgi:uncharacterized protein
MMNETLNLGAAGAVGQDRARTLFGQTMGYVALTAGVFALAAYLGRHLPHTASFVAFFAAFACLLGMRFAVRRSGPLAIVLLLAVGALLGVAMSPILVFYVKTDPQPLWQASGATALFIGGFGSAGYATRRDLSGLARACFWALLGFFVLGIVLIVAHIPHGALIYSVLGLVIFAGVTMVDFQRLRRSTDLDSAPLLAASIFVDVLNVFMLFLRLFSQEE